MKRDLVFLDTETSGLDCNVHGIMQVGLFRTDPEAGEIKTVFETLVQPYGYQVSPEALKINGLTLDYVKQFGMAADDLIENLERHLRDCVVVGQNINFDLGFIQALSKKLGGKIDIHRHNKIDTTTLAWPLKAAGKIDSLSLTVVAEYLNIPQEKAHDALEDAKTCLKVYRKLVPRYINSLQEDTVLVDNRVHPMFRDILGNWAEPMWKTTLVPRVKSPEHFNAVSRVDAEGFEVDAPGLAASGLTAELKNGVLVLEYTLRDKKCRHEFELCEETDLEAVKVAVKDGIIRVTTPKKAGLSRKIDVT